MIGGPTPTNPRQDSDNAGELYVMDLLPTENYRKSSSSGLNITPNYIGFKKPAPSGSH